MRLLLLCTLILMLAGCATRLKEIGRNPELSEVGDGLKGHEAEDQPVVYANAPGSGSKQKTESLTSNCTSAAFTFQNVE